MNLASFKNKLEHKYLNKEHIFSLIWKIVRYVIIIGLCYVILYPFVIKLLNSFKTFEDFLDPTVKFISKKPDFFNIVRVFKSMNYFEGFFNTFSLSLSLGLIQMFICTIVGYGFARFKFPFRNLAFLLVILTMLIPPQTIMIPLFMRFRFNFGVNLINTYIPLYILSLTGIGLKNGLYIFLMRQFFSGIPKELEEAATIDGCRTFKIFTKIMLPPARSMMVTVFLFAFSWQWTDMFFNNLFVKNGKLIVNSIYRVGVLTLEPILVSSNVGTATILAILPLAIIYVFAQKLFVQSIDRSGIVG